MLKSITITCKSCYWTLKDEMHLKSLHCVLMCDARAREGVRFLRSTGVGFRYNTGILDPC